MDETRRESAEVLYTTAELTVVDKARVDGLVRAAEETARRRVRLCTHPDAAAPMHEMLIVHERGAYVRPHRHRGKSESLHVISGSADLIVLTESGEIERVVPLGTYESGRAFYYRMGGPRLHTLRILSDIFVFHEATTGPFLREQTEFPSWAPDGSDAARVSDYLARLEAKLNAHPSVS